MRAGFHLLTQVGGVAWALSLLVRRRLLAFGVIYAVFWAGSVVLAPAFGRVPLPCTGEVLRMQSPLYCAMLRHFVVPDLAQVAQDAAETVARSHPGTVTLALDAGFPFLVGMPLLPHLSRDDSEKLDLAFYDTQGGAYLRCRAARHDDHFHLQL